MSISWHRSSGVLIALALLALAVAVGLSACGESGGATASTSPSAAAQPSPSASIIPATEPVTQWDAPGTASAAQALALTRRYAAALHAETLPKAGLYTAKSTMDYWETDMHVQGGPAIEEFYRGGGDDVDWPQKHHIMVASGVGVDENFLTVDAVNAKTPALALLAVDGDKIRHEEIFINPGDTSAVVFATSTAWPHDTAKAAADVCAQVGEAFKTGDRAAMQTLVSPDVLFRDVSLTKGTRGWSGLAAWWDKTPTLTVKNKTPIAGPGWAVGRWTVYQTFSNGFQVAMPGATVMEVRNGKVARMTLYYDSGVIDLQT